MRDLEVDEERRFVKECWKRWGLKVSKFQILGDRGYPDRCVWFPGGKPMFFEFKRSGFAPDPKQIEVHRELKVLGYLVEVHDNADSALQTVARAVAASQLPTKVRKVPT